MPDCKKRRRGEHSRENANNKKCRNRGNIKTAAERGRQIKGTDGREKGERIQMSEYTTAKAKRKKNTDKSNLPTRKHQPDF